MRSLIKTAICSLALMQIAELPAAARDDVLFIEPKLDRDTGHLRWDFDGFLLTYKHACEIDVSEDEFLRELSNGFIGYRQSFLIPEIVCNEEGLYFANNRGYLHSFEINGQRALNTYSSMDEKRLAAAKKNLSLANLNASTGRPISIWVGSVELSLLPSYRYEMDFSEVEEAKQIHDAYIREESGRLQTKRIMLYAAVITGWIVLIGGLLSAAVFAYKIIPRKLTALVSAIKRLFARKDIPIINRENITAYSAADELLKWQQLKVSGTVSEEEFEAAKRRILNKN